ncbi:MAG: hypothetical protein J7621_10295 [Niastella sp.]|nr:hypothetical protein [Niastella sp.]
MTKKTIQYIISIVIIGLLIFGFYNPYRRKNEIKKHLRYTVAVVYKESSSLKNGEHYHYKFHYNGNEYEAYNSKNRNYTVIVGDWYVVEFSYKDPSIAVIHYEWPVPHNLAPFPDTGWAKVPDHIILKNRRIEY